MRVDPRPGCPDVGVVKLNNNITGAIGHRKYALSSRDIARTADTGVHRNADITVRRSIGPGNDSACQGPCTSAAAANRTVADDDHVTTTIVADGSNPKAIRYFQRSIAYDLRNAGPCGIVACIDTVAAYGTDRRTRRRLHAHRSGCRGRIILRRADPDTIGRGDIAGEVEHDITRAAGYLCNHAIGAADISAAVDDDVAGIGGIADTGEDASTGSARNIASAGDRNSASAGCAGNDTVIAADDRIVADRNVTVAVDLRIDADGAAADGGRSAIAGYHDIGIARIEQYALRRLAVDRARPGLVDGQRAHRARAGRFEPHTNRVALDQSGVVDRDRARNGRLVDTDQWIDLRACRDVGDDTAHGRRALDPRPAGRLYFAIDIDRGQACRKAAVGFDAVTGCGQRFACGQRHTDGPRIGRDICVCGLNSDACCRGDIAASDHINVARARRACSYPARFAQHVLRHVDIDVARVCIEHRCIDARAVYSADRAGTSADD